MKAFLKNIPLLAFALSTLVIFGNGCDLSDLNNGGGGGIVTGSNSACTNNAGGTPSECFLYPSSYTQDSIDTLCSSQNGTESESCSSTNLLGTCSHYNNSNGVITYFYISSAITSQSTAAGLCANESGTFTAQ